MCSLQRYNLCEAFPEHWLKVCGAETPMEANKTRRTLKVFVQNPQFVESADMPWNDLVLELLNSGMIQ
jgi:hypothetical protein